MLHELANVYQNTDIKNYIAAPLLSDTDYIIISFLDHYESLNSPLKQLLREEMSKGMTGFLLVFAERVASYLINEKDQKLFQAGLHSLDVCMDKAKLRDIYMILSLYHDVYIRHMFVFADYLSSSEPLSQALHAFLLKDTAAKSIGAMGYAVEHNTLGQAFFKRR
jgi:F0F1-type ATP synthase delta subunit